MKSVLINAQELSSWDQFHDIFSKLFDFPEWYGRNMNAWVDCMSDLDEENMTSLILQPNEDLLIEISNCAGLDAIQEEIFLALIDSACFVNYRRVEAGSRPYILLSYFK